MLFTLIRDFPLPLLPPIPFCVDYTSFSSNTLFTLYFGLKCHFLFLLLLPSTPHTFPSSTSSSRATIEDGRRENLNKRKKNWKKKTTLASLVFVLPQNMATQKKKINPQNCTCCCLAYLANPSHVHAAHIQKHGRQSQRPSVDRNQKSNRIRIRKMDGRWLWMTDERMETKRNGTQYQQEQSGSSRKKNPIFFVALISATAWPPFPRTVCTVFSP